MTSGANENRGAGIKTRDGAALKVKADYYLESLLSALQSSVHVAHEDVEHGDNNDARKEQCRDAFRKHCQSAVTEAAE